MAHHPHAIKIRSTFRSRLKVSLRLYVRSSVYPRLLELENRTDVYDLIRGYNGSTAEWPYDFRLLDSISIV